MKKAIISITILFICGLFVYAIDSHTYFEGSGTISVEAGDDNAWMQFFGQGTFSSDLWITDAGHGMFDTDILAWSGEGNEAYFGFSGWQNLFGYTNNRVVANAFVWGDNEAFMNLRFDNSMYVVQLERVDPNAGPLLYANGSYGMAYGMNIEDKDTAEVSAYMSVGLFGDGWGMFDNSHWFPNAVGSYGWGNPDGITFPTYSDTYHPYTIVAAGGSGNFNMQLYGQNYLFFGGLELPGGGSLSVGANFFDGMNVVWEAGWVR